MAFKRRDTRSGLQALTVMAALSVAPGCATYSPWDEGKAVAAPPGGASPGAKEAAFTDARAQVARAEAALGKLDVVEARRFCDAAARALPPAPEGKPWHLALDVEVLRAVADVAEDKQAEAVVRLRRVAEADPAYQVDEARIPPEVVTLFARARAELAPSTPPAAFTEAAARSSRAAPADDGDDRPWYRTGWCWGIIGAVVLVSVGASARRQQKDTTP